MAQERAHMNHWMLMMRIYFWSALTNRGGGSDSSVSSDFQSTSGSFFWSFSRWSNYKRLQYLYRVCGHWKLGHFPWNKHIVWCIEKWVEQIQPWTRAKHTIKESYHMHLQPYPGMLPTCNSADIPITSLWNFGSWGFTLQCAEAGLHNKPIVSGPKM